VPMVHISDRIFRWTSSGTLSNPASASAPLLPVHRLRLRHGVILIDINDACALMLLQHALSTRSQDERHLTLSHCENDYGPRFASSSLYLNVRYLGGADFQVSSYNRGPTSAVGRFPPVTEAEFAPTSIAYCARINTCFYRTGR
jgi:hypothetical protein